MNVGCRNALRGGKGWRPPEVHLAKPAASSSLAGGEGESVGVKHKGGGGEGGRCQKLSQRKTKKKAMKKRGIEKIFVQNQQPAPHKEV